MINRSITNVQRSFNCDFEKAVFNAARKVFGSDLCIYGCYFHLAQNIQKRISKYDLLTTFYSSEDFRTNTQFLKTLCFLPVNDVVTGLIYLKSFASPAFIQILKYFETNYVGNLIQGNILINIVFKMYEFIT